MQRCKKFHPPGTCSTSILSNSAGGMVAVVFAVAMKSTCDRSKATLRKWSVKLWFCSGSRTWEVYYAGENVFEAYRWWHGANVTSSRAAAGSPCKLFPSLSTSSRRNTGLLTPTVFRPLMIRPGMLPTYVRLENKAFPSVAKGTETLIGETVDTHNEI